MKFLTLISLFASAALAQYISNEPSGSDCDGTYYSQSAIDSAATEAVNLYNNGETRGRDKYPHQYNDYEGFSFNCASPYLEYPIQTSGTYDGGSPGPDRVVIGGVDGDGAQYCGVITHDGQSGDGFAECSDE